MTRNSIRRLQNRSVGVRLAYEGESHQQLMRYTRLTQSNILQ